MAMLEGKGRAARRRGVLVMLVCVLAAAGCVLSGCGPDESRLAARYDGGVVTEDEVDGYTATFREQRGYDDDETWALYLFGEGLASDTWRQQAIGSIVEERLVQREAESQGIVPDEARIDEQIAQDREAAGIDADDAQAWRDYLASQGTTEQGYRDELRKVSLETQLYRANVGLDAQADVEVLDEYIQNNNLVSRVVRRYRACGFEDRAAAEQALSLLQGLSGDALEQQFAATLLLDDADETTEGNGGDIGWDIAGSWGQLGEELVGEMLQPGQLSATVHEHEGMFYVVQCTDRYVFTYDSTYETLPDDALRDYVLRSALFANWSDMISDYVAGLVDAAHVQMKAADGKLPYDVDARIAELKAQVSR